MAFFNSGSSCNNTTSIFSLPTWLTTSSWNATISLIASKPNNNAPNISSSDTSFAPDSTMLIAFFVPATVKSISDCSCCSIVGFNTYSPLTRPTCTPAIGPSNGISEIERANEEPNIAAIAGEQSCSTLITILVTCTSFLKPSANIGRIGRSIKRAVKVASVDGRPSRLIKPPGTLPTAYIFSS